MTTPDQHICEFAGCDKTASHSEEWTRRDDVIWLCEDHFLDNKTGYCSRDCCLGHGCDGSC